MAFLRCAVYVALSLSLGGRVGVRGNPGLNRRESF